MIENKRFTITICDNYRRILKDKDSSFAIPLRGMCSEAEVKLCDTLNSLHKENEELKQENKTLKEENKHYKYILQDFGLLMSDEEVRDIRIEIADKIIKPLCKENGFDVDVDCTNGFTIIPKR